MQIISLSLGLNRDFVDKFMDKPIAILRFLVTDKVPGL